MNELIACVAQVASKPDEMLPIIIGELVALCVVLGWFAFRRVRKQAPPQS